MVLIPLICEYGEKPEGPKLTGKVPFDLREYVKRTRAGPCFVCEIVAGNPDYRHHVIYEDDEAIVFLNKYPTLYGYVLVAPKAHREQVTGDFSPEEYLSLQSLIYRVAEALRQTVPTERLYLLSLGSLQGNRHVHWHIAALPPGVPYEEQQLAALALERGVLVISEEEKAALARTLGERLAEHSPPIT
jgi:diadenosine tetraphosphate (Ap4A) HIT family hydrolase